MKHFLRPEAWAPLLGYLLLVTVLLLVANGIVWLSLLDENGKAIINLRLHLFTGLSLSMCLFAFFPNCDTQKKSSRYAIFGSVLIFACFVGCVLSMPEIIDSAGLLHVSSALIGVGFACTFKSAIYLISKFDNHQFMFLFAIMGILAIVLYSIIDGCPQNLGIALTLIMPCVAVILFSGMFPKYERAQEFSLDSTFPPERTNEQALDYQPDKQIYHVALALFIFLTGCLITQGYYLDILTPESIYTSFTVSFVVSILILSLGAIALARPVSFALSFRTFNCTLLGALVASTVIAFSGQVNEIAIGINLSITSLSLAGCVALFFSLLPQCSKKVQRYAIIGPMLSLGLLSGFFILGTYFSSIRVYFVGIDAVLVFSSLACCALATLVITSTGSISFLHDSSLFAPHSLNDESDNNRKKACSILSQKIQLTEREEEVLILLAQGYKNKNISEKLFVSVNTVSVHVRNIYAKAEIHSRADLMEKLDGVLCE